MDENRELKLYKLIMHPDEEFNDISYVDEFGWVNEKQFCVWISYVWIKEFIDGLKEIFGYGLFDDGTFNGNMQSFCICIDLCAALDGYDIDLERIFPKDKYEH